MRLGTKESSMMSGQGERTWPLWKVGAVEEIREKAVGRGGGVGNDVHVPDKTEYVTFGTERSG